MYSERALEMYFNPIILSTLLEVGIINHPLCTTILYIQKLGRQL